MRVTKWRLEGYVRTLCFETGLRYTQSLLSMNGFGLARD